MQNGMKKKQQATIGGSQGGFTLVETLVGLFVFTVGILAVAMLTTVAFDGYSDARRSTQEVSKIARNVEILKATSYFNDNSLQDSTSGGGGAGGVYTPGGLQNQQVRYTVLDDTVVAGTKFIVMQNTNTTLSPAGAPLPYQLFLIR